MKNNILLYIIFELLLLKIIDNLKKEILKDIIEIKIFT